MDELDKLSKIEGLEFDIDIRMKDLWNEAFEVEEWTDEVVATLMRAAYGIGYMDAIAEYDAGERAKLNRSHGYKH
jgi:hypothetical protein